MVIFGAIDFSAALAKIAAGLGYRVTIADPRRAFLDSPRFAAFAETEAAWPDEVLARTPPGPRDAVLVFTHDAKLDVPALMAAFETEAGYIGALGSRQTTRTARRGCAPRGPRTPISSACTRRAASTSARPPWRRRRSPCWRR